MKIQHLGLPALKEVPIWQGNTLLDGSLGQNRRPKEQCKIEARNDYEAVLCWLHEYRHKGTTYRSYQKEAERLLLWCIKQRHKPLSSLTRDDFEAYFDFLLNPQPAEAWCSVAGHKSVRGMPQWRPFEGPLSSTAQATAISIVNSLVNYLVFARYLDFNPLDLMRYRKKRSQNVENERLKVFARILEMDEWQAMLEILHAWPEDSIRNRNEKERLNFLVSILFLLGLRIHELETHDWNAFRQVQGKWWFFVKGKGDKAAKIPVNEGLLAAVRRYRLYCNKADLPTPEEQEPLIQCWRTGKRITARHMSRLLKDLGLKTAERFSEPHKVAKLKAFSPHWLRHLSATMQDKVGIKFKHILANHRHENEETTRKYVHAFDEERHEDMEKLKLNSVIFSSKESL